MTFEIYLLIKIVSKMNDPKTVPKKKSPSFNFIP